MERAAIVDADATLARRKYIEAEGVDTKARSGPSYGHVAAVHDCNRCIAGSQGADAPRNTVAAIGPDVATVDDADGATAAGGFGSNTDGLVSGGQDVAAIDDADAAVLAA